MSVFAVDPKSPVTLDQKRWVGVSGGKMLEWKMFGCKTLGWKMLHGRCSCGRCCMEDGRDRNVCSAPRRSSALTIVQMLVILFFVALAVTGSCGLGDHLLPRSTALSRLSNTLPHTAWPDSEGITYEELKKVLLETPNGEKAREWSNHYTSGPHLAGKNLSLAEWTREQWLDFGIDSAEIVSYDTYLNYPCGSGLALLENGQVTFRASLEEDVLEEDPTTGLKDRVPVFHGYSANGNVTGQFVYANYGTHSDYDELVKAGIDLTGKIVLVRYGANFRGLKVKRASELGAIGVVIYSDPGDDGQITEEHGYQTYPNGPARNPSAVQRGSVLYLSMAPGDPTTTGYPSKAGVPRQSVDGKIPNIPSLPISFREALPLLTALNGYGPNASSFSESWQSGGLGYKGVNYNVGPSPENLTVNLFNQQEYVTTPIWNVIGVINGTIPDEVIIIGNHRDAWIAGGAGDPNSGSAALDEVIRSFGKAIQAGWKPQRTIVFASWDGEEYGLLGSTEWVEEFLPWLSGSAVAYINVDVGASGTALDVYGAPLLNQAFYNAVSQVQSPNQTVEGQTVRDLWNGQFGTLGSGSDFTAFIDFGGIPSIDFGFTPGPTDPVYHYHSNYDSFSWMERFGDPGFEYHVTIARITALLAGHLAEQAIIPFNSTDYALALGKYLDSSRSVAANSTFPPDILDPLFDRLDQSISRFQHATTVFDASAAIISEQITSPPSSSSLVTLYHSIRTINMKYKYLERNFLSEDGLDQRHWFKHVVFAPGRWSGYAGVTFPCLNEALEDNLEPALVSCVQLLSSRIDFAAVYLLQNGE